MTTTVFRIFPKIVLGSFNLEHKGENEGEDAVSHLVRGCKTSNVGSATVADRVRRVQGDGMFEDYEGTLAGNSTPQGQTDGR